MKFIATPVLLILSLLACPANAALLSFGQGPGVGDYNFAGSGLFPFIVTGGFGGGFALPVLSAHTDVYPGDSSSAYINVGGHSASASGKCLGQCGTSTYPAQFSSNGTFVPIDQLKLLIPFQFDQSTVVPYQYTLIGHGYRPDGSVSLEALLFFNTQGQQISGTLLEESGVVPEPTTLLLAIASGLMLALLGKTRSRTRRI